MQDAFTVLKYISIIQRNTQKFFDLNLCGDQIGSGQQFFILRIAENEGMMMHELAQTGNFDKGTVTKDVKKLWEEGYIRIEADEKDGRVRRLYTTKKAEALVQKVYRLRDAWNESLMDGLTAGEADALKAQLRRMAELSCRKLERDTEREGRKNV